MIEVKFHVWGVNEANARDIQADLRQVFAGDIKIDTITVRPEPEADALARTESTTQRPGCIPGYTGKAVFDRIQQRWRPVTVYAPAQPTDHLRVVEFLDAKQGETKTRYIEKSFVSMCTNGFIEGAICP